MRIFLLFLLIGFTQSQRFPWNEPLDRRNKGRNNEEINIPWNRRDNDRGNSNSSSSSSNESKGRNDDIEERKNDNRRGSKDNRDRFNIPNPFNIIDSLSNGRSNSKRRNRPLDKAHAFANLRKFGRGKISLKHEDWNEHAEQFCQLFPHNSKCRNGQKPKEEDLDFISKAIEKRQKRRIIPRIKRKDWLAGVPELLKEKAKNRRKFGVVDTETRGFFRDACKSGRAQCRKQPDDAIEKRKILRDHIAKTEKEKLNVTEEEADDNVEIRFDRTLRIKRALLEKANLTAEVDPIDDGIFESDILLTEKQSDLLLNDLDKADTDGDEDLSPDDDDDDIPSAPSDDHPNSSKPLNGQIRKKRSGVFVEDHFTEKWDISSPILYTFDSSIAPWDETDIKDALTEISRVSCIRFQYSSSSPNGYHINFVKINSPTFCGLSYIGRVSPVNTVYLSFACGKNKGVVMHETLHALGVIHQHLRMDRDTNIKIDWSNVNPQKYDQFAVADQNIYSSYGIKYSYDSIMHYNAYTNAIDIKKPTMIPLMNSSDNLKILGQRDRLSNTDITLINKMYCKPASCVDTNIFCGHWSLSGVCTQQGNSVWMSNNCKKSCNLC